jgi:hypothetical protein
VVGGSLPHAGATALVRQRPSRNPAEVARRARAATDVAAEVAASSESRPLTGRALEYATSVVAAAVRTVERLENDGWRVVSGDDHGSGLVGRGAVVDRSDPFDPLAGLGN